MKKLLITSVLSALLITVLIIATFSIVSDNNPTEVTDTSDSKTTDEQEFDEVIEPEEPKVVEAGQLDCSNCWLAPVDKNHFLSSSYAPEVVSLNLSGGGSLAPEAAEALRDLFSSAQADGIKLGVISSYRSYSYQQSLFERYVQEEMAKGLSRTEAEKEANTYSARAGMSEHQLGTTADIGCVGCAFEESQANLDAWAWLKDNAGNFGFVLSYPKGRTADTGYIYEPWHWRYIGVDNAEVFNAQDKLTLNNWLADRY